MIGLDTQSSEAITLSVKVAAVATLAVFPLALGLAVVLARGRFPGRSLIDALAHLPLVLPPVATGWALLILFGRRGPAGAVLEAAGLGVTFRWTGAALAAAVMALPLMIRPIRVALESVDRDALDAAKTLGAGPLTRFARITLPQARNGLSAAAVLGFAKALGEFGATITFVGAIPGETLTLPSAIWQASQDPDGGARALSLCAVSAALALGAVLASEALQRRARR